MSAVVTGRQRSVLMTYPGLRTGNVLYLALQAHRRRARGEASAVLDPSPAEPWSAGLPQVSGLLLDPARLRFTDERVHLNASFFQAFGVDFQEAELRSFVQQVLLPPHGPFRAGPGPVVVNVRRGDYWSDEHFRSAFGYDIEDFLRRALDLCARQTGPLLELLVVSDDPAWCRQHLAWLDEHAGTVSFNDPAEGPLSDLVRIAGATRSIITNSTFSYWGAYIGKVLHAPGSTWVCAPDLHSWAVRGGRPWQHDPDWVTLPVRAVP